MAVSLPRSPQLIDSIRDRLADAFPQRATSRRLHVWRMVTLPFWFGSDVPPPMWPRTNREQLVDRSQSAAGSWLIESLDTMTFRFWISWCLSSVLRGAALGALVAVLWSLLATAGLAGTPSIFLISLFVVGGMLPGLGFGLINRPSPARVAMMIDRTFALDERLITAIDSDNPPDNDITIMQQADAANSLLPVLREIRLVHLMPVRECVLVMVAVTSALAIWMFAFDSRQVDASSDSRLPGYYAASERLADQQGALPRPPVPEEESSNGSSEAASGELSSSNDDVQDLGELGAALDQHDLTKPAANAIAGGDLNGASSALEASAGEIAGASQAERDALADDLDEAADAMSETNPDLAEQTRKAADAIREGGSGAEAAVNDLAKAIEDMAPPENEETESSGGESGSNSSAPVGEQDQGSNNGQSSESGASSGDSNEGGASDPGSGSEAEPGLGEASSSEGEGETGETTPGDTGGSPGDAEAGGEGGASETDPGSGGSSTGTTDESDGNGGESESSAIGDAQDETSGSQGSGAGSGQTDANDEPIEGQNPNTTNSAPGDPAEEKPAEAETGDAPVGETVSDGEVGSGGGSIDIGGSSTDTVQSGNDVGSSSLGSGSSGADVAGGNATGEPSGPAGPDSNTVPEDYEDIVGDYFSEPAP
ncbi:MAG: hypothetical protein WKF81_13015 [Thermomicrobiales bacterium]